jgi:hypothetical protein
VELYGASPQAYITQPDGQKLAPAHPCLDSQEQERTEIPSRALTESIQYLSVVTGFKSPLPRARVVRELKVINGVAG